MSSDRKKHKKYPMTILNVNPKVTPDEVKMMNSSNIFLRSDKNKISTSESFTGDDFLSNSLLYGTPQSISSTTLINQKTEDESMKVSKICLLANIYYIILF